MKAPSKSETPSGSGFRAAKTSATSSGATRGQFERRGCTTRPTRAEFSQRENSHHPKAASRRYTVLAILALCFSFQLFAVEVIPPAPTKYFNDYANAVAVNTADQLNETLANFERDSSSPILVAVYPKMQSDSSIEDYTVRVARAWKVGQKDVNNGVVLFVFIQDRKMYIQVGYGLEGKLPDALCKRIIEDEIKPHFKAGNYTAGLTAGVQSLIEAARGEYRGTGRTAAQGRRADGSLPPFARSAHHRLYRGGGPVHRRHSSIAMGGRLDYRRWWWWLVRRRRRLVGRWGWWIFRWRW